MSRIGNALQAFRGGRGPAEDTPGGHVLLGDALMHWAAANDVAPADLIKTVRDGGTVRDLSELARGMQPMTAMGAPFTGDIASTFDPASMGPGEPARPFPLGGEPRQFNYRVGRNMATSPEADRGVDTQLLRTLADSYDLLRKCIQIMKAEIGALEWDIVPKEKNRRKREQWLADNGEELDRIRQFFLWPEAYVTRDATGNWVRRGTLRWSAWIGALLEDYYVGDFLTIWPRHMLNGQLLAFDRVDGATIKPLIDQEGRVPTPPYPAFQQYLYGAPRASFTLEELLYRPRTVRSHTVYGFSHVEQMLVFINLCLRVQMWNTQAYTDGALPLGLLEFPENFTVDQIQEVVDILNAVTSGDSAARQQFRGVPSGTKWSPIKPFEWNENFAQYLVEYTCALFGLNAQKLGFMPGRGGVGLGGTGFAEQQAENSDSNETIPTARWVAELMNELLERCFGRTDIQFEFTGLQDQDEKELIETNQAALFSGQKSLDQILQEAGEDPLGVDRFVVIGNVPWSIPDLKAIQDEEPRTPSPGLPVGEQPEPPEDPAAPGPDGEPPSGGGGGDGSGGDQRALPPGERKPSEPDAEDTSDDEKTGKAADADAVKTLDLSSGLQPHGLMAPEGRTAELRRWKRKAVKDAREGRPPRPFRSDVLPDDVKAAIATGLQHAGNLDEVRLLFDRQIAKAAAEDAVVAAGICVLADDTGRVLLLQRSIVDDSDPAAGRWEFPGGCLEPGEDPLAAAIREWQEETGAQLPAGELRGSWISGVYTCFILAIAHETDLVINQDHYDRAVLNPDDPDGDEIETVAWWDPADLPEMPALRDEARDGTDWEAIDDARHVIAGKAVLGNPGTATDSRKDRTQRHEMQLEAALAAVLLAKRKIARQAGTLEDTRRALELGRGDVHRIGRDLARGRSQTYIVGANRMLTRLDKQPLARVPAIDQLKIDERAQSSAQAFADAWHAQLDGLLTAADADTSNVIDGVARFQQWKARQVAIDNATGGYNAGALAVANREGLPSLIWATEHDDHVCDDCEENDGKQFSTVDATVMGDEGLHPGCRCEWELDAESLGGGMLEEAATADLVKDAEPAPPTLGEQAVAAVAEVADALRELAGRDLPAPHVTVEAAPAPHVHVEVQPPPPPDVHVDARSEHTHLHTHEHQNTVEAHVEAAEPPNVHVTVEQPTRGGDVVVRKQPDGSMRLTREEE